MGDLLPFRAARLGGRLPTRRGTSATQWYELGVALESADPRAAMRAYERAIAGLCDLADAHNNLGRLHHDAGDRAVAESCYRLACCADPTVALYWFNLGVAVEDQGRRAEAIALYERAVEVDPSAADAHFNLARLYEQVAHGSGDDGLLRRSIRHLSSYRRLVAATAVRR